jgi:hypothetical protein
MSAMDVLRGPGPHTPIFSGTPGCAQVVHSAVSHPQISQVVHNPCTGKQCLHCNVSRAAPADVQRDEVVAADFGNWR